MDDAIQHKKEINTLMINKFSLKELFILCIALIPALYLLYIYPSLPETVPVHFNFSGKPDDYAHKSTLFYTVGLLTVVTLGVYLLIKFLPNIDPKKTARVSASVLQKISVAMVVFFSAINIIIIYSSVSGSFNLSRLFNPLLGLFFTYIGNLMHNIKPNYFVGIRVPWTLEDPNNWRATHQMGGKLWVAGGIVITISTLLLPPKVGEMSFMVMTAILAIVPIAYSYLYFKKHQQQS
jgi:uncharacterized membrane protein